MCLYIVCLKDFPGKGNSILLTEFFAGADVNINFAVLRPCVHTDMPLGNNSEARKTGIPSIRGLNIVQVYWTDLLHTYAGRIFTQRASNQAIVAQKFAIAPIKL